MSHRVDLFLFGGNAEADWNRSEEIARFHLGSKSPLEQVAAELLNNLEFIEASMRAAAAEARATVVNSSFHKFGPQGISGVLVLAESHLSVHTWPEHGYAATDIYVCGDSC
ncbi:MAG: adenosylmethionine decarboxylase, partial [Planctomycetes bacterium]|nr:adenosylmethionine decarboxylase [Planctomycetota bacterium]